jgi:hypothetical protein
MLTRITRHMLLSAVAALLTAAPAPAALSASDDFSDGNFTANPAWTANAGTWSVSSGVLNQTVQGPYSNPIAATPFVLQLNGISSDGPYVAQVDMGTDFGGGNTSIGIAFHVQDANNMDAFVFFPGWPGGALRQLRFVGGVATTLHDVNMGFTPAASAFHTMRLSVDGANFILSVNNGVASGDNFTYTGNYSDATYTGGGIGLISQGNPGFFDNFTLVPEPASAALLGFGALVALRRRGQAP